MRDVVECFGSSQVVQTHKQTHLTRKTVEDDGLGLAHKSGVRVHAMSPKILPKIADVSGFGSVVLEKEISSVQAYTEMGHWAPPGKRCRTELCGTGQVPSTVR
jgi:hypothetical protein